jgi:hypothetical protein
MNKLVILALSILFTLTVMISSCSNNLDQAGFPGFRCAIGNTTEYIADSAVYITRTAGNPGTNIFAYTGGKIKFAFYLLTADTNGMFNLDSTHNVAYYNPTNSANIDPNNCYRSISGSLAITEYYNDSLKMINGSVGFNGRAPGSSGNSQNFSYGYFNNVPRRY